MHSAIPGGCCGVREPTVSDAAGTKTATGTGFAAEFGTATDVDVRPPDRCHHHPSASGDGHP